MKKYTSVLMLHTRSTIYKILFVFAYMAGIEFFLFSRHLKEILPSDYSEEIIRQGLSPVLEDSRIILVFLAAFFHITMILVFNGMERKEKITYTIRRLTISEKQYYLIHGLYNCFVYLLLVIFQVFVIFLLSLSYFKTVPDYYYSNQTLFLTFYNNTFLHSLLPLEETVRIIKNICTILALGFTSAFQSYCQRRGKKQWGIIVIALSAALTFYSPLGSFSGDAAMIVVSTTALILIAVNLYRKGDGYEI